MNDGFEDDALVAPLPASAVALGDDVEEVLEPEWLPSDDDLPGPRWSDERAASAHLTERGVDPLFDTPRHRPDFAETDGETYYQIMFETPDRILLEFVWALRLVYVVTFPQERAFQYLSGEAGVLQGRGVVWFVVMLAIVAAGYWLAVRIAAHAVEPTSGREPPMPPLR